MKNGKDGMIKKTMFWKAISLVYCEKTKTDCSPKLNILFVSFSVYSFTQFEYQKTLNVPNISNENTFKYSTNLCSVNSKKNIYLVIPHILSANSEQTHHTLVSYLKVSMVTSGVVC